MASYKVLAIVCVLVLAVVMETAHGRSRRQCRFDRRSRTCSDITPPGPRSLISILFGIPEGRCARHGGTCQLLFTRKGYRCSCEESGRVV